MPNMAKIAAFPLFVVLQIVCAAAAGGAKTSGKGLPEACKRTKDVTFCTGLLQQYASEFEDNDHEKMGFAAISASLARAQAAKAFMVRRYTDQDLTDAARAAVKGCFGPFGDSIDSLRMAAREFDKMRGVRGDRRLRRSNNVVEMIKSAGMDQKACYDSLRKDKQKIGVDIVKTVGREAQDASKSSLVALAFVQ